LTGNTFNFPGLSQLTKVKGENIGMAAAFELHVQFCGSLPCVEGVTSAVCLVRSGAAQATAGLWDGSPAPTAVETADGVVVTITGKPRFGEQVWETTLTLKCGSATEPTGNVEGTKIALAFSHPDACKGGPGGGLSGGSIFLIILLVVSFVYVVAGCIWNVKRNSKPFGRESCPNAGFWGALPGHTKAGCAFTYTKLRSLCNGRSTSSAESSGYGTTDE
jgi:hypothetical protein